MPHPSRIQLRPAAVLVTLLVLSCGSSDGTSDDGSNGATGGGSDAGHGGGNAAGGSTGASGSDGNGGAGVAGGTGGGSLGGGGKSVGGSNGAGGGSSIGGSIGAGGSKGVGGTDSVGGSSATGGADAGGQTGGGGGAPGPTCKQAGGNRCAAAAEECAGLTAFMSSDCVACCLVPQNPVYESSFADPFVVRVGGTYYAFATNAAGKTIPRLTSKDLATWMLDKDSSLNPGSWSEAGIDDWAPTVYQAKDKTWVMFYAGKVKGATKHCLGRATASSVTGTFVDSANAPFHCSAASAWSLDPSVFQDKDGKDYLLWRQDTAAMPSGTIHIRPLDATGHFTATAEQELLQRAKTQPTWEFDSTGGVMENPSMVHAGGTYHLFYSGFRWQTADYATGHATCDAPMGPCKKTSTTKPWQGSLGKMLGPGGADFVEAADGTTFMYMHGWKAPDVGPGVGTRMLWFYRFVAAAGMQPSIAPL